MKLTTFTDYSLRVLIYLAAQPARRATISEVAASFGVSENHLTKVVHLLGRHGWVATLRGKGGGMVLARPASEICIGHVVRGTEGQAQPAECFEPGGGSCAIRGCCGLKAVLAEAVGAFYRMLDRYTLADLVRQPQALVQLLGIPRVPSSEATFQRTGD